MAACKSWLVAAITRTSARIRRLPPMRSNSCSCKTRRSAIWCSDNLFKHRGFVDFFTHSRVLALKPIFSLLAILDESVTTQLDLTLENACGRTWAHKKKNEVGGITADLQTCTA